MQVVVGSDVLCVFIFILTFRSNARQVVKAVKYLRMIIRQLSDDRPKRRETLSNN